MGLASNSKRIPITKTICFSYQSKLEHSWPWNHNNCWYNKALKSPILIPTEITHTKHFATKAKFVNHSKTAFFSGRHSFKIITPFNYQQCIYIYTWSQPKLKSKTKTKWGKQHNQARTRKINPSKIHLYTTSTYHKQNCDRLILNITNRIKQVHMITSAFTYTHITST